MAVKVSVVVKKLADRLVTKDKLLGVSLAGILGMIVGILLLFYNDLRSPFTTQAIFHEIVYDPAAIVRPIAQDSIEALEKRLIQVLTRQVFYEKEDTKKDSVDRLNENVAREKDSIVNALKVYRSYLDYTYNQQRDSIAFKQLNKALYFDLRPSDVDRMDKTLLKAHADFTHDIRYDFRPAGLNVTIRGQTRFALKRPSSDVWFITGNNAAGIWALFIIIFCTICFMALPVCFQYLSAIKICYGTNERRRSYIHIYWWTFCAMLLVLTLMWLTFYDSPPVRDLYILDSLWTSLFGVMIIGYAAGGGCFAGFVYAGYRLDSLHSMAQQQAEQLSAAGNDPAKVSQVRQVELKAYNSILGYFNGYFIIAAVILSFLVLCVGALYQAVNNQSFVKLLTDDWGYSPVPQHFIYLYGAVHTLLLLIFYLPTKLSFRTLVKMPAVTGSDLASRSRIKNPVNKLGEVLIGTLPLLASIVPPLIDFLFGE
jgi:hypothetical protein